MVLAEAAWAVLPGSATRRGLARYPASMPTATRADSIFLRCRR